MTLIPVLGSDQERRAVVLSRTLRLTSDGGADGGSVVGFTFWYLVLYELYELRCSDEVVCAHKRSWRRQVKRRIENTMDWIEKAERRTDKRKWRKEREVKRDERGIHTVTHKSRKNR